MGQVQLLFKIIYDGVVITRLLTKFAITIDIMVRVFHFCFCWCLLFSLLVVVCLFLLHERDFLRSNVRSHIPQPHQLITSIILPIMNVQPKTLAISEERNSFWWMSNMPSGLELRFNFMIPTRVSCSLRHLGGKVDHMMNLSMKVYVMDGHPFEMKKFIGMKYDVYEEGRW